MATTGLETFDRTLHKTHEWLNEVAEELGYGDKAASYHALRAVLHTLRDGLTVAEAADFAAQLPLLLKGVFFDAWSGRQDEDSPRDPAAFFARVAERYDGPGQPPDAEGITRAVLAVVHRRISAGEIADVVQVLPQRLAGLWPAS